jgi:hypothetical protein
LDCTLGPCIPNFFPNIRVEFRVGTSFRESGRVRKKLKKLIPTLIFGKSQIFANFRDFFTKIHENQEKKHGNYRNISEIQKTAISETRENKNFGKNRLMQGLIAHQLNICQKALFAFRADLLVLHYIQTLFQKEFDVVKKLLRIQLNQTKKTV